MLLVCVFHFPLGGAHSQFQSMCHHECEDCVCQQIYGDTVLPPFSHDRCGQCCPSELPVACRICCRTLAHLVRLGRCGRCCSSMWYGQGMRSRCFDACCEA